MTSLCQASLLQSIGFFVTDTFGSLDDLAILISVSFALISISAIVSQYLFTDLVALNNYKLLICGGLLMALSYYAMSYSDTIAIYYLTLIFNGFGVGMMRPATASSLSLSHLPENQRLSSWISRISYANRSYDGTCRSNANLCYTT